MHMQVDQPGQHQRTWDFDALHGPFRQRTERKALGANRADAAFRQIQFAHSVQPKRRVHHAPKGNAKVWLIHFSC